QPHIIVRFMALRSSRDARYGFVVGMSWMILCVGGAVFTALAGLAYFQQNQEAVLTDATTGESVFLDLARLLFHPMIAGPLMVAGRLRAAVLAAVMSPVSSQLIVSSSPLIEDFLGGIGVELSAKGALWGGRIGVLAVSVIALLLALDKDSSVLSLVGFAWAGF